MVNSRNFSIFKLNIWPLFTLVKTTVHKFNFRISIALVPKRSEFCSREMIIDHPQNFKNHKVSIL